MKTIVIFIAMSDTFIRDNIAYGSGRNSVVYTRWGRKSCRGDAKLVHSGKL